MIRESVRIDRKRNTEESRANVRHYLLKYVMGRALADRLFRRQSETCARFVKTLYEYKLEYTPRAYLYHLAPKEIVPQIMEQGLVAPYPYHDENGLVFMTYAPKFLTEFLKWKTERLGKSVDFVRIKIDAKRLAEKHKLYYYRELEIVTDCVEPEYIIV